MDRAAVTAHRDDTLKIPNSALRFRLPDQTPSAAPKRDPSSGPRQPGGGNRPAGKRDVDRVRRQASEQCLFLLRGKCLVERGRERSPLDRPSDSEVYGG